MTIELGAQDKADLANAQQAFVTQMRPLTEEQQISRATVLAGGLREADPYTRALAQQVLDASELRGRIKSAQEEVKDLERELRQVGNGPDVNPAWRGAKLSRKDDLVNGIELDHARLLAIHEDNHATPKKKAALHFREQRAQAAKNVALNEAVTRIEKRLEAEAIERQAEQIARARLLKAGRSSASKAGEAQ